MQGSTLQLIPAQSLQIVNKIKSHIEDNNHIYEQFKGKTEVVYNDPCYLGKSMSVASDSIASYLKKIDRELDKAAGKTEIKFEYRKYIS